MNPFVQSVLMQPPVICGRRLNPFSLFHAMLLNEFDSPLMIEDIKIDVVGPRDVYLLLYICSMNYDTGAKTLFKVIENDGLVIKLYRKYRRIKVSDYDIKLALAYIDDYTYAPEFWDKEENTGVSGIPWPFKTAADLICNAGFSKQEAWDMPVNQALSYRANMAENNGFVIISDKQKDLEKVLYDG